MSENCPIRYIITVNALKEGWDCPFAYILASLANKTSKIDVEQIVGRILRQPNAKKNQSALLNTSFVFTCSNDFRDTLESLVKGLNGAGFSRKDYRIGEEELPLFAQEEKSDIIGDMKRQMRLAEINDELGATRTGKKEFLEKIEIIIP